MQQPDLTLVLARNGQFVRALARSLARDPAQAEDLTQETWLRYLRRPPQAAGSLRHWFRTVTRNLVRDDARAEARRGEREAAAARVEAQASVAEEYEHAELLRGVVEAVLALEEPYRSTLLARYWRGWSAARVAEETGTPLATVRSREQRALEQLRAKLDRGWKGERGAWGLALARLLASEPVPGALAPVAPALARLGLARLGLAAGALVAGGLAWRALAGAEPPPAPAAPAAHVAAVAAPPRAVAPPATLAAPAREPGTLAPAAVAPPVPETQAFSAPPPSEVRVRFVYADGTPAAGVECTLELGGRVSRGGVEPSGDEAPEWEDQHQTSGPDGRVAFAFDMPAEHTVGLQAVLPQHAAVGWDWHTLAPGQVLELGDAAMKRAGVITGRLVRPDGTPLVGGAWRVGASSIGLATPEGREDTRVHADVDPATGAFRLEGAMPGTNGLDAYSSLSGRVEGPTVALAEGGAAEAEIVFDGPDPARRILVDVTVLRFRTALQLAPESVRLLAPGAAPRTADSGTPWGSFAFDDVAPGSYTLAIDDPRCAYWLQEGVTPGTRVRARVEGSSSVVLAVSDAATGLPAVPDEVRVTLRHTNHFPNVFTVADLAGGRIAGMFAGDSTVEVLAGGRIGRADVDGLAPGETRTLAVVVAALPPVAGHARVSDGAPAAGAMAALVATAPSGDSDASPILELGSSTTDPASYRRVVARAPVAADGSFALEAPADGTYLVRVTGPGGTRAFSETFALASPPTALELVLPRPGSLTGQLPVPSGAATAGLRVRVVPEALAADGPSPDAEDLAVPLGSDGRFAFASLAPGPARVFLALPRPIRRGPGSWSSTGGGWYGERLLLARELGTVTIPEGESLAHDFALEDFPGTVELTVRVNGAPAPWLAITLRSESDEWESLEVSTDERGVYSGPLFAGTYALAAEDRKSGWSTSVPAAFAVLSARPTVTTVDLER